MSTKSRKSTSSSSTSTVQTTNANLTDNQGGVTAAGGGDVTINLTPAEAFDLGEAAVQFAADLSSKAIGAISELNARAIEGAQQQAKAASKEVTDFASQAIRPDAGNTTDIVKYGALAAVALAGVVVLSRR